MSLVFLATTPLVLALFRRNGKKPDAVLSPLEKTAAAARGGLDVKVAFDDDADAEDDARDDDDDDALLFPAKRRKGGWCCFGPLILSILLLKKAALLVALLLEKIVGVVGVVGVVVVIIAAFVPLSTPHTTFASGTLFIFPSKVIFLKGPKGKKIQRYKP